MVHSVKFVQLFTVESFLWELAINNSFGMAGAVKGIYNTYALFKSDALCMLRVCWYVCVCECIYVSLCVGECVCEFVGILVRVFQNGK